MHQAKDALHKWRKKEWKEGEKDVKRRRREVSKSFRLFSGCQDIGAGDDEEGFFNPKFFDKAKPCGKYIRALE